MKKITKLLMVLLCFVMTSAIYGQTITGIVHAEDGPLPGANIIVKGTKNGTTTDFDGKFSLKVTEGSGIIEVSFVGYNSKDLNYTVASGETKNLGTITLISNNALDEIVITAVSFAIDRKTPIAVSTIKAAEIELKLGTQEFPEILKSTPGVFATKAGGGFGDGRINLRGFDSQNVAVLINGVPINDMESGRVFWSNWAGLGDVTSAIQVQRGLGASKVAVPSIGGTINIVTKTTDVEAGGNFAVGLANDGREKFSFTYSTGLSDAGFAATVSVSRTEGDGYVDGTEFNSFNYFVNLSKQFNDQHKLTLTAFGAKQRHGQRQNRHSFETFRNAETGRKFNSDWGYKQGQVTYQEDNFFHKPQISLNHYWIISDKTNVSTAAYASFGSGGGGGFTGVNKFRFDDDSGFSDYRRGAYGPIDFDKIVDENIANGVNGSETILRASRNNHEWYGVLSTLKTDLSDNLALVAGIDYRYYRGEHFTEVTDLLGGQYYFDVDGQGNDNNVNNPLNAAQVGDKIRFHNDGIVNWLGGFTQLEYTNDKLSAFVSLSASNTSYKRVDFFQKLNSDPGQETDVFNFFGGGAKGGVNYNLDDNHNVFFNLGYLEKAADFRSVWPTFDNEIVNEDAENQKITSYELGYGFRGKTFSANLNVYRTEWNDRTEFVSFDQPDGTTAFANILGVNALHQGIEFDFVYRASDKLTLTGMASLGDWTWQDNIENVSILDENQVEIDVVDIFIKDLHVGDAAQTTMALGAKYKIGAKTTLTADYNYFNDLYADFDPSDRGEVGPEPWKAPDYGLFDATIRHKFEFAGFDATLTARMNNIFDTEYVADAQDRNGSTADVARVYIGFGRTFSTGIRINF